MSEGGRGGGGERGWCWSEGGKGRWGGGGVGVRVGGEGGWCWGEGGKGGWVLG